MTGDQLLASSALFLVGLVAQASDAPPAPPWIPPTPRVANPPWKPTWNMSMSTIIFPCNHSGWFSPQLAGRFGIVSIDFENTLDVWAFMKPTDQESRSLRQAEMIKAINPDTKVFVYRNLAKSEAMQATVRAKLEDPRFAGFFLRFAKTPPFQNGSYHVTKCGAEKNTTICSDFYHDLVDTPLPGPVRSSPGVTPPIDGDDTDYRVCNGDCDCGSIPCAEFVYDHRNASLTKWLIEDYIGGPSGTGSPHVDGVFIDDFWCAGPNCHDPTEGPTEMNPNSRADMGLSESDMVAITKGARKRC